MIGDDPTTTRTRVGSAAEVAEIRRLYAAGQIEAAMKLADQVRARDRIPLTAVPVVTVTPDALMKLPLDARAGFVLTRIDGYSNVQDVIDMSAMPADEAMVLLEKLETLGALALMTDEDEVTRPRVESEFR
jgi:hypothetical protein